MKSIIFLFTCFIAFCSWGQKAPGKVYNRIDSITTIEQAQDFLNSVSTLYKIKAALEFKKLDINNDGRTDLILRIELFASKSFEECQMLCIIDAGKDSFITKKLTLGSSYPLSLPNVQLIDGQTVIICSQRPPGLNDKSETDTLLFSNGAFIDFDLHPKHYNIEKIQLQTEPCMGSCPVFTISIDSNRRARLDETQKYSLAWYEGDSLNKKEGKYHAIIDKPSFVEVIALLEHLDFTKLVC